MLLVIPLTQSNARASFSKVMISTDECMHTIRTKMKLCLQKKLGCTYFKSFIYIEPNQILVNARAAFQDGVYRWKKGVGRFPS